jgi:hypothetical protein
LKMVDFPTFGKPAIPHASGIFDPARSAARTGRPCAAALYDRRGGKKMQHTCRIGRICAK